MNEILTNRQLFGRSVKIWWLTNLLGTGLLLPASFIFNYKEFSERPDESLGLIAAVLVVGALITTPVLLPIYLILKAYIRTELSQTAKIALAVSVPFGAVVVLLLLMPYIRPVGLSSHLIAGSTADT